MSGRRFTAICEFSAAGAFLPTFSIQISKSVIFELLTILPLQPSGCEGICMELGEIKGKKDIYNYRQVTPLPV